MGAVARATGSTSTRSSGKLLSTGGCIRRLAAQRLHARCRHGFDSRQNFGLKIQRTARKPSESSPAVQWQNALARPRTESNNEGAAAAKVDVFLRKECNTTGSRTLALCATEAGEDAFFIVK